MFSSEQYYYLTKDIPCKILASYLNSELLYNDYEPKINLDISLTKNVNEKLYLEQASIIFIYNGEYINKYYYFNVEYDFSSILDKFSVKILNIQTHLILFDTKGNIFEEHEKYALNKYCNIKFKFVNSIYPENYKYVIKPIELRNNI
jgi:hypothetical protein